MIAAATSNLSILKLLIEEYSANINQTNLNGTSALVFACNTSDDLEIVIYLCEHGADPHCVIESGDTPLSIASSNGFNAIVTYLCRLSLDLNQQNIEGKTPLLSAIEGGHSSTVLILIQFGALVNFISEISTVRMSPLVLACLFGELEIVRILLAHGADTSLISDRIISSQRSPKFDDEEVNEEESEVSHKYEAALFGEAIREELLQAGWLPRLDVRRCCEADDLDHLQILLKKYEDYPQVLSLLTNNVVSSSGGASGLLIACLHGSIKVVDYLFTLSALSSDCNQINLRVRLPLSLSSLLMCVRSVQPLMGAMRCFTPYGMVTPPFSALSSIMV
jgi:ankyrin repeat protein